MDKELERRAEEVVTKFIKAIDGVTPYPQMRARFEEIVSKALDEVRKQTIKEQADKACQLFNQGIDSAVEIGLISISVAEQNKYVFKTCMEAGL